MIKPREKAKQLKAKYSNALELVNERRKEQPFAKYWHKVYKEILKQ